MKEYYKMFDKYACERHINALDLNFKYIDGDNYELPEYFGRVGIIINLTVTGREQLQILKSACQQVILKLISTEELLKSL